MKQILVLSELLDLSASEALFISQVDWLLKRERVYDACHFNRWNVHPGIGPHVWLGELLDRSTDHKWSAKELRDEMTLFIERSHAYLDQLMVGAETGYGIDSVNLQRVKEELNAELNNPTEIHVPKWASDGSQSTERPHFQGARDTLKMEGQRLVEEFKTLIEERLALTVRRHPSISGIPNGAACYRRIISFETGGLYTPESALEMATHFVAQFRSQLMAIEQVQTEALRGASRWATRPRHLSSTE